MSTRAHTRTHPPTLHALTHTPHGTIVGAASMRALAPLPPPPRVTFCGPLLCWAQVEGITIEILRQALSQAGEGRRHILAEMEKCSPPPRRELAEYTPRVIRKPVRAVLSIFACSAHRGSSYASLASHPWLPSSTRVVKRIPGH